MSKQLASEAAAHVQPIEPHWRVLFSGRPRPLVVPARHRRAQRRSVQFFVANPLRRWWARLLLELNRAWPPLLPALPAPAARRPAGELSWAAHTAFQIGTPGPYQKASMLIMTEDGAPVALSKIALKPSAVPMIQNESRWLEEFNLHPSLAGHVPRLLGQGTTRAGRPYLVVNVASGRSGTNAFTPAHAAFLRELSKVRYRRQAFADSPAYYYIASSLARLKGSLPTRDCALLSRASSECGDRLQHWEGPFVLAHGDFAPWNLRRQRDNIVVFDWEYAEEGAIALRDICHFLLIPRALARGGIDSARMSAIVDDVRTKVCEIHPQSVWERRTVAALILGCLLHTVLFHAVSRGYMSRDDVVANVYRHLIEERARWIA